MLFDAGISVESVRQRSKARLVNLRQPAPSPTLVGDSMRKKWIHEERHRSGPSNGKRVPAKGGKRIMLCGGCGLGNDADTVPVGDCCDKCGSFYANGEGSQVTHQIIKDNVKGNRAGFACGATNKARGIYGRGTVVTREYSNVPPLPGMIAPSISGAPLYTVQPAPAVKTITVPPRKSYAYSITELIKKTNMGYDANLAIRGCGIRNGCTGDCACTCSLCCQANLQCSARNGWSDGVCPGGMTGNGTSCTTGSCDPTTGPCACQSWTYKRRNGQFAANAAVDSDLLTSRMARTTQVAEKCNSEQCARDVVGDTPCPANCACNGLLARTRDQIRRIPQELHQPKRR